MQHTNKLNTKQHLRFSCFVFFVFLSIKLRAACSCSKKKKRKNSKDLLVNERRGWLCNDSSRPFVVRVCLCEKSRGCYCAGWFDNTIFTQLYLLSQSPNIVLYYINMRCTTYTRWCLHTCLTFQVSRKTMRRREKRKEHSFKNGGLSALGSLLL